MNNEVVITCAVTGSADTAGKHPELPVTPQQIATAAIEAAKAGAAIVHIHVRDPETGKPARDPALFREVVDRVRSDETDVIVNLTAGMGGDWVVNDDDLNSPGPGSDLADPIERLAHVEDLLPDICTLDCGTLNFGDGNSITINTPDHLRRGAKKIQQLGVKPELEMFDTGNFWFAMRLVEEGLIDGAPMLQFCHGIPWGMPADPGLLKTMVDQLPAGTFWTSFAISRLQMPWVAQSALLGGHVRVGLEDNLYLERGVFASNAQLVEKACSLLGLMGAAVVGPDRARALLGLKKRG